MRQGIGWRYWFVRASLSGVERFLTNTGDYKMFCWHKWSKWVAFNQPMFNYNSKTGEKVHEYSLPYQRRVCEKCGFIQEREI